MPTAIANTHTHTHIDDRDDDESKKRREEALHQLPYQYRVKHITIIRISNESEERHEERVKKSQTNSINIICMSSEFDLLILLHCTIYTDRLTETTVRIHWRTLNFETMASASSIK